MKMGKVIIEDSVLFTITAAKYFHIEAENEEQAMSEVHKIINKDPYEYISNFSHFVGYEVVDAFEDCVRTT